MKYIEGIECKNCGDLDFYRYGFITPCQKCGNPSGYEGYNVLVLEKHKPKLTLNPLTWYRYIFYCTLKKKESNK